jgi:hypothetical protein
VHQALAMITCSHGVIEYRSKISIHYIDRFWTDSTVDIRKLVAWLLAKDSLICTTKVPKVSSKFPSCLIIVLTINFGVQVLICSDWNCESYSPNIVLQHMASRNEIWIIDWRNQPNVHCPCRDGHSPIVCQSGKQASLEYIQGLVQAVEGNVSLIKNNVLHVTWCIHRCSS